MATSGSFNTNKEGNFYCTVSWSRTGYDATKNEHYISYSVVAHNSAGKYRSVYTKELTINNSRVYYNTTSKSFYDGDVVTSGKITIKSSNNAGDGSLSISFKAGVGTSSGTNISGSGSWSLNRIPRYATANQSLSGKTETTISINWSSDSVIDYIWYSTNNGSSWTGIDVADGTSGNYTISGLAANTTYNIKTRVRRKDSQLTTDSSTLSITTYNYPYCTEAPNFTIGNNVTIKLYNPLNRTVNIQMWSHQSQQFVSDQITITGVSYTGFSNIANRLYQSIPNSKTSVYNIDVLYGSHKEVKVGGTYQVNVNECLPTTGTFTYQDTKASTVAITGNNQLIIQNNSTLQITVTGSAAKKSATLVKASVNINGVVTNQNFAAGSNTVTINIGTINVANNINIPITITDSRGITSTANLSVQVLPWSLPNAIIKLERISNYYTTTNLTVDANYSSLNGENTITIQYQIKKTTDANYGDLITLQDNVQTQFQADNLYEWDVRIILTDRLGTTTYNLKLGKGIPIVFFDRNKRATGFNCFPTEDETVEINGNLRFTDKTNYEAIRKTRTFNNEDYQVSVGVGGNNCARMEYVKVPDIVLNSVEIRRDGIYNGVSGKKLAEQSTGWIDATKSSYIDGTVRYTKIGNIVIVNFSDIQVKSNLSHSVVLASGLPTSTNYQITVLDNFDAPGTPMRIAVNLSGQIVDHYSGNAANNNGYYGTLIYITNE